MVTISQNYHRLFLASLSAAIWKIHSNSCYRWAQCEEPREKYILWNSFTVRRERKRKKVIASGRLDKKKRKNFRKTDSTEYAKITDEIVQEVNVTMNIRFPFHLCRFNYFSNFLFLSINSQRLFSGTTNVKLRFICREKKLIESSLNRSKNWFHLFVFFFSLCILIICLNYMAFFVRLFLFQF